MSPEQLKNHIEKQLNSQNVIARCSLASRMWIIEVIIPKLGEDRDFRLNILSTIEKIVATTCKENPKIWKILLYSHSRQRFNVDGILKTSQPTVSRSGHTIPLMAIDCCVWLTEYDGEVLRFGDSISGRTVCAIESTNAESMPILPFQNQKYLYLETLGQTFSIAPNGVKQAPKSSPLELEIKLV